MIVRMSADEFYTMREIMKAYRRAMKDTGDKKYKHDIIVMGKIIKKLNDQFYN